MKKPKISKNWDCVISYESMIQDCIFAYIPIHGDKKPHLAMSQKKDGWINGFCISHWCDGICVDGEYGGAQNNVDIETLTTNPEQLIIEWLEKTGAGDLIIESTLNHTH